MPRDCFRATVQGGMALSEKVLRPRCARSRSPSRHFLKPLDESAHRLRVFLAVVQPTHRPLHKSKCVVRPRKRPKRRAEVDGRRQDGRARCEALDARLPEGPSPGLREHANLPFPPSPLPSVSPVLAIKTLVRATGTRGARRSRASSGLLWPSREASVGVRHDTRTRSGIGDDDDDDGVCVLSADGRTGTGRKAESRSLGWPFACGLSAIDWDQPVRIFERAIPSLLSLQLPAAGTRATARWAILTLPNHAGHRPFARPPAWLEVQETRMRNVPARGAWRLGRGLVASTPGTFGRCPVLFPVWVLVLHAGLCAALALAATSTLRQRLTCVWLLVIAFGPGADGGGEIGLCAGLDSRQGGGIYCLSLPVARDWK